MNQLFTYPTNTWPKWPLGVALLLYCLLSFQSATAKEKPQPKVLSATNPWQQIFLTWNSTQDNAGSGVVRAVRIDPSSENNALAGATTSGIWRTTTKGASWSFVSGGVPEVEWVNEIVFSRQNPNIVYAATDMGIVKSTDAGQTWAYTGLKKTFPDKYGSLVWVDITRNSSDIIYATTQEGNTYTLHKSTNGGTSWSVQYQTTRRIWDMRVKPDDQNVVYILEESSSTGWINFKRSTNSGSTFSTINNGFPADYNTATHRARLATTIANNSVVYIAIGYNGGGSNDKISFFKSSDAGLSFGKKCCGNSNNPLVNASGSTDFLYETCHLAQLSWNFAFTVSETDENFLACAANKLKISTDGGATWQYDLSGQVVTGSQYDSYPSNNAHTGVHGDHHGLSVSGSHIWNSNDGGVYYSGDGGWTVVKDKSDGMGIQELWGFSQSFKNDVMAVGLNHNQICYRDDNIYGGWIGVNGADAMAANVNPIDDQYMYNHPWGHERVKRSLTGKTGHQFQNLGIELGYITLDNLEFHPHHYYTIYGSNYGDRNDTYKLAKTTDNANTWQTIKSFEAEQKNAVSVKVSYADPSYVYAVVEPNRVIKSTDEGATWTEVGPPASLHNNLPLWRMAVSDQNPEHIWVTVKNNQNIRKVLRSTDGGATWSDYSTGLPSYAIYSIIYQRGSDDLLYVGTRFGIYYRKNGMSQWELFGTGMPACNTSFMFINYAKGKIRVGTSRGLWENDLFERTAPKANIAADRTEVSGDFPTVKFADFSVVDETATFQWQFPGGDPASSTEERPVVSYANAPAGSYDVTLTVTDSRGTSTQTLTGFIVSDGSSPSPPVTVYYVDSETTAQDGKAINAIDGSNGTIWHTKWSGGADPQPHEIQLDLGASFSITGLKYMPRQDQSNGRIAQYEIYVSEDPTNWGAAMATGTWPNTADQKTVNFTAKNGRYIRLRSLSEVNGNAFTSAAEISAIKQPISSGSSLTVHYVDSEETSGENGAATNAIDGDNTTIWHTKWAGGTDPQPHEIQLGLGATYSVSGLTYLPRQNQSNGRIAQYEIYVSTDGTNWGSPVATGTWQNTADLKTVNFSAVNGNYVRLRSLSEVNGAAYTSAAEIDIIKSNATPTLSVHYVDSEELSGENGAATNAIDADNNTIWHTKWAGGTDPQPHEIQLSLGGTFSLSGLTYLPRQDGSQNGRISQYEVYVSEDPANWGAAVASGTWANSSDLKTVNFTPKTGNYIRLRSLSEVNGSAFTSAAEINVIQSNSARIAEEKQVIMDVAPPLSEEVNIFPVPFSDNISIKLTSASVHERTKIRILDMKGRVVYRSIHSPNDGLLKINTSDFQDGVYVVELKNAMRFQRKKIVKGNVLLKEKE